MYQLHWKNRYLTQKIQIRHSYRFVSYFPITLGNKTSQMHHLYLCEKIKKKPEQMSYF
jgi:hypothetical protein